MKLPSNEWLREKIASDPDDEPTAGPVYGFCSVCGFPLDYSRTRSGLHCIAISDPENPNFAEAVRKHLPLKETKMTVRAKLTLSEIRENKFHPTMEPQRTLRFTATYDTAIPEDQRFQKATPSGHCELQIDNPAALAQFELGKAYYVDFTPAA